MGQEFPCHKSIFGELGGSNSGHFLVREIYLYAAGCRKYMFIRGVLLIFEVLLLFGAPMMQVGSSAVVAQGNSEHLNDDLYFIKAKILPEMGVIAGIHSGDMVKSTSLVITDFNLRILLNWSDPMRSPHEIVGEANGKVIFTFFNPEDFSFYIGSLDIDSGGIDWQRNINEFLPEEPFQSLSAMQFVVLSDKIYVVFLYSVGDDAFLDIFRLSSSGAIEDSLTNSVPLDVDDFSLRSEVMVDSGSLFIFNSWYPNNNAIRISGDLVSSILDLTYPEGIVYPFSFSNQSAWIEPDPDRPDYLVMIDGNNYTFSLETRTRPVGIRNTAIHGDLDSSRVSRLFHLSKDLYFVPTIPKATEEFDPFGEAPSTVDVGLVFGGEGNITLLSKNFPLETDNPVTLLPLDINFLDGKILWVWEIVESNSDNSIKGTIWVSMHAFSEDSTGLEIITISAFAGIPLLGLLAVQWYRKRRLKVEAVTYPET